MILMTAIEVSRKVSLGISTIYRLMARGEFPAPIKLTKSCVRWVESEIDEWIAARPRARGGKQ